jgi:hypothetical protein
MKRFHLFVQHPTSTMDHLVGSFDTIEAAEDALAAFERLSELRPTHARLYRANDEGALEIWRLYMHFHKGHYWNLWRVMNYEPEHRGEQYRFFRKEVAPCLASSDNAVMSSNS